MKLLATDWQSHVKKSWEFKANKRRVKIVLLADPSFPNLSSLEILYEGDARPSLTEEVGFLREVLRQFPTNGIDLHSLRAVSMRGFAEPEVTQRVAAAALHSKAWHSRTTTIGGAERVVQDLLNSLGAYNAFNGAFEEYGLSVKVQSVEKVASARCLDMKVPDPACNTHYNPHLPVGANLRLALIKK